MTSEQKTAKISKKIFELEQQANTLIGMQNSSTLPLGEVFMKVKEEMAKLHGRNAPQEFKNWLASPERKRTTGYASLLINLYKFYIVKFGLRYKQVENIDTIILDKGRRLITKENIEECLAKFRELSRADIIKLIKYGDKDEMTCPHSWEIITPKARCKICGAVKKI